MFKSVNIKITLTKWFDWLSNDIDYCSVFSAQLSYILLFQNHTFFVFYNLIINTLPLFHCPFNILCGTSFSHPEESKRWSTSSILFVASQIALATLRSWKVVCQPHIIGISAKVPNIHPVLFFKPNERWRSNDDNDTLEVGLKVFKLFKIHERRKKT